MNEPTTNRWRQIEEVLHEARRVPPEQRPPFLDRVCGADTDLRREVDSLLAAESSAASLEGGVVITATAAGSDGLPAGTRLGAYRIVKLIGRGGMGEVYLAERADGAFEQQAAAKVMRPEAAEHLLRFEAERQILARLEHPNIAGLLDGGVAPDGRPYMLMEYVTGQPLLEHCRERRLSLLPRLDLFDQICDAVAFAHANLVVHRDLKPNNILVTAEGRVKLLDFGVAKLLGPSGIGDGATLLGAAPLTPDHAAPEQLQGKPVTTATDVYALGIVLYEMLTGRSPWAELKHLPISAALDKLLHEEPKTSSEAAAANAEAPVSARLLGGDLDAIIAKALRKLPGDRYPTVAALQADVERYRRGEPVSAGPDSALYRSRKFLRRNRVASAVAAGILVLVAGFTWQLAAERNRALAAERQASAEAAAATQVSDYLVSLFRAAGPDQTGGKPIQPRKLVDDGKAELAIRLKHQPALRARMLGSLGRVYCELGLPTECKASIEEALALHGAQAGADPLVAADYLYDLSGAELRRGEVDASEKAARRALAERERLLPPGDVRIAEALARLGRVLTGAHKIEEGVRVLERALAIQKQAQGEDSLGYADVLSELVPAYAEAGELAKASAAAAKDLDIVRRIAGTESARYADSLMRSAGLHADGGDNAAAEVEYREALAVRTRVLGADSFPVAETKNDLAITLTQQGKVLQSLPLLRDVVAATRIKTGPDSPEFGTALNNLGVSARDAGDFATAVPALREAQAVFVRNPGASSMRVALMPINLAGALTLTGALDEAAGLLTAEIPADAEGTYAATVRARRLKEIADNDVARRRFDRALMLLDQAEAFLASLPPEHLTRIALVRSRGNVLAETRRYAEAEGVLKRAAELYERAQTAASPFALSTRLEWAQVLLALGRRDEARAAALAAAPLLETAVAPEHPARTLLQRLKLALVK